MHRGIVVSVSRNLNAFRLLSAHGVSSPSSSAATVHLSPVRSQCSQLNCHHLRHSHHCSIGPTAWVHPSSSWAIPSGPGRPNSTLFRRYGCSAGPQPGSLQEGIRGEDVGAAGDYQVTGGSGAAGPRGRAGAAVVTRMAPVAVRQSWHRPDLAAVLVNPQIPQNTGNVARTCAATATPLHLVGPLGFDLDDRKLKRAGLDYWGAVAMSVHGSWDHFFGFFRQLPGPKRLVAFTVYGESYYAGPEFRYQPGDWLVFGAETSGLPPQAHADVTSSGGALVKIPIRDTHVRSINMAVAAGVGLFEAIRQLDEQAGGHEVAPRLSPTLEEVAAVHRDGKPLGQKARASVEP